MSDKPVFIVRTHNAQNVLVEEEVRIGCSESGITRRSFVGKVVLVGNASVGKTQFSYGTRANFDETFASSTQLPPLDATTGTDFCVVPCEIGTDTLFRVQIWDTAGQERYHSLMPSYLRNTHGVIIMFDVSNLFSWRAVDDIWLPKVREQVLEKYPNTPVMLIGNKSDLQELRAVPERTTRAYAAANHLLYCETSALFRATIHAAITEMGANMHYFMQREGCAQLSSQSIDKANASSSQERMIQQRALFLSQAQKKSSCCG